MARRSSRRGRPALTASPRPRTVAERASHVLISDLSIKRPVLDTVVSLLLIVLGLFAFTRLPLRELPDIDPPVVSINTSYTGASAAVVETRITQVLEDAVSGIEGVDLLTSSSRTG